MNQTIIHNPDVKQLNVLDSRFYPFDDVTYFPSVTTILEVYPKGFGFNQWLKDVGNNASEIVDRAKMSGSRVHNACDLLAKGHEITWMNAAGESLYSLEEWKMILNFKKFIETSEAKIVMNERSMINKQDRYGGTIDLLCTIAGKTWLIDIKTSNYIHTTHELQLAAYTMMVESNEIASIDNVGVLWLKAQTRTDKIDHKKGIYQGEGWQLKTFERSIADAYKVFEYTHKIWLEENPVWKPLNQIYPDTISLK